MPNNITINAGQVTLLALGEITEQPVFAYENKQMTTKPEVGPNGKQLFNVGPFAAEASGSALGQVRVRTEAPGLFQDARLGTAYIGSDAVITIRPVMDKYDLSVAIYVSTAKKAGAAA